MHASCSMLLYHRGAILEAATGSTSPVKPAVLIAAQRASTFEASALCLSLRTWRSAMQDAAKHQEAPTTVLQGVRAERRKGDGIRRAVQGIARTAKGRTYFAYQARPSRSSRM